MKETLKTLNRTQIIAVSCIVLLLGISGIAVAQTGILIEDFEDGESGVFPQDLGNISEDNPLEGNYSFVSNENYDSFTTDDFTEEQVEIIGFYIRIEHIPSDPSDFYYATRIRFEDTADQVHTGLQFIRYEDESQQGIYLNDGITPPTPTKVANFTVGTTYSFKLNTETQNMRIANADNGSLVYDGPLYINEEEVNIQSIEFQDQDGGSSFSFDYFRWGEFAGPGDPILRGEVSNQDNNPISNALINITQNGEIVTNTTTNSTGMYSTQLIAGDYNVTVTHEDYLPQTNQISTVNATNVLDFILEPKSALFDFRTNSWMEHGSTQPYSAYYHGGDSYYRQSVTDNTTVTSGNTSVITVNQEDNTLESAGNVNISKQVPITAEYSQDGENFSATQNVTVANRTIDNIEIMPTEQWVPTVLGFGESGTAFGLGSEIQWIFVSIFTGASAAWMARNEWIGIGVIMACNLLFWPLGNVGLGMVMVTVFYGLFAAYQLNKIPSRSDTNVGNDLGSNNQKIDERRRR